MKISVLLNLVLLGWLCLSLIKGAPPATLPPKRIATNDTLNVVETMAASPIVPMPAIQPPPFRWDQLYSRDYHAYVKNLRAIGCPEATLQAIVTADVGAVIQQRADALEKK